MTNSDTIKANFLARKIHLLEEKRNNAEDIKDLGVEMKNAELSKVEIDGINLAAKRKFESVEKREHRVSVEQVAEELGFADTPLGAAAIELVAGRA